NGVSTPGTLFLRVGGTGIVALGGLCQIQSGETEQGTLPTVTVTLHPNLHLLNPSSWGIENPNSIGLNDPADIAPPSDRAVALKLQALDPTLRHTCDVEVITLANVTYAPPSSASQLLPIYDLKNCTSLPPTCTDA